MNTNRTTTIRRNTLTVVALIATLGVAAVPTHAATGTPVEPGVCSWTVDQLPYTPDAVEGWYGACQAPRHLGTPDATEAWLR